MISISAGVRMHIQWMGSFIIRITFEHKLVEPFSHKLVEDEHKLVEPIFTHAGSCTSNGWVHLSSELHLNTSWWNHFHTSWLKMNTSWWNPFSHTLVHASDALPVIFNPRFAFSSSKCLCVRAHTHVCTCMCVCMHVCVVIEGLTNMIMTGAEKIIVCILCGVCVCCSAYVWYFFIAVNQDYNRRARHTN